MPIKLFSRMQEAELSALRERHTHFIDWLTGLSFDDLSKKSGPVSSKKPWDGYGVTITPAAKTRIQRRDGMEGLVICTYRHGLISDVFHAVLHHGSAVGAVRPDNRLALLRRMALAAVESLDESDRSLKAAICAAAVRVLALEVRELDERICQASAGMALP